MMISDCCKQQIHDKKINKYKLERAIIAVQQYNAMPTEPDTLDNVCSSVSPNYINRVSITPHANNITLPYKMFYSETIIVNQHPGSAQWVLQCVNSQFL